MNFPVEMQLPTQQLLDALPDAVVIIHQDGRIVFVNGQAQRLFGYAREELLDQPVEILLPERFRVQHPGHRRSFFGHPHVRPMESGLDLYGQRKDGSEFPVDVSISPMQTGGQTLACAIIRDITGHVTKYRKLDARLLGRTRELEDFIENASIGLHWVARDGTILWANQAELDLLGYSREEYVGRNIREFHADPERLEGGRRRLEQDEKLHNFSARLIHKDGSPREVLIDASVYRENGEFVHTRAFTRDITGRRRAEAALRESEARLQSIFNSSSDLQILFRAEPDGGFVTEVVNRTLIARWKSFLGKDVTGCVGKDFAVLLAAIGFGAEEIEHRRLLYQKVLRERETVRHHTNLPGIPEAVELSLSPVLDQEGRCTHVLANVRIETERRRAEAALRESQARLQLIFDSTVELQAFLRVEPGGRFILEAVNRAMNESYRNLVGRPATDFIGQEVEEILQATGPTAEAIESRRSMYQKAAREKIPVYFATPASPRREAVEVWVYPVLNANGECTHLLWNARVITEQVRAEAALRENQARLQLVFDSTTDLQALYRIEPGNRLVLEMANRAMQESLAGAGGQPGTPFEGWELGEVLQWIGIPAEEIERRRGLYRKVAREKTVMRFSSGLDPRLDALEFSLSPVLDQNGECTHVLLNARVITERLKAEEELRKREAELAEAQRIGHIGSLSRDIAENKLAWSDEMFRILGYEPQQFEPSFQAFLDRVHPDDRDEVKRVAQAAYEAGTGHSIEHRIVRPDGSERFVKGRTVVQTDAAGKPLRVFGTMRDVTEERQATAALHQREAQLSLIFNATSDLYMLLRVEPQDRLVVEALNPAHAKALAQRAGVADPSDLIGLDDRELLERLKFSSQTAARSLARYRQVRDDKAMVRFEAPSLVSLKDETLDVVIQPVLDSQGKCTHVLWNGRNITELKRAEAREARRLQRLKQLSELSMMLAGEPAAIFERIVRMVGELFDVQRVCIADVTDRLNFTTVYLNGQVRFNMGSYTLEATPCAEAVAAKDILSYQRVQELFPHAEFLREYHAYSYCVVPSLDSQGKVVAVISLLDDKPREYSEEDRQILRLIGQRIGVEVDRRNHLSGQARMEEQLHENQRRLEEAQRMARLGSFESDPISGWMAWTDEVYRIMELDPAQVKPSPEAVLARVHPDDHALVQKAHEDAVRETGTVNVEQRVRMPDGRIKYVLVRADIIAGADGKPQMRGTVQDITERKLAEQEREKLQAQLLQAQKMESIGRLAGGVAHDFNNLLTVINGYSSVVLRKMHAADPDREAMEGIHRAGDTAAALVRQLLAFSRRQVLHLESVSLNGAVSHVEPMLRRLVGEDIAIVCRLTPDPDLVTADRNQIEQVIVNLAVNARDAMPGGGTLTIETRRRGHGEVCRQCADVLPPGDYVELAVRDTGSGMDQNTREHLFEPFFTTKETGKGTGLGLSMVQGIVTQSGGCIGVESEPGKGSTFRVYLPVAEHAPEAAKPAPVDEPAGGKETVLLVEDNASVRQFTVAVLEGLGYRVVEAEDAESALTACAEQRFDLLLTDVLMPGMSGVELAERVRSIQPELKILLMSGYSEDIVQHRQRGGAAGAALLQKPFSPETLAAKVREVLGSEA